MNNAARRLAQLEQQTLGFRPQRFSYLGVDLTDPEEVAQFIEAAEAYAVEPAAGVAELAEMNAAVALALQTARYDTTRPPAAVVFDALSAPDDSPELQELLWEWVTQAIADGTLDGTGWEGAHGSG